MLVGSLYQNNTSQHHYTLVTGLCFLHSYPTTTKSSKQARQLWSKQAKQVSQPLNGDDDDVSARSKENDDEDTDASERGTKGGG